MNSKAIPKIKTAAPTASSIKIPLGDPMEMNKAEELTMSANRACIE